MSKCSSRGRPPKKATLKRLAKAVKTHQHRLGAARTKLAAMSHKYRRCKA